MASSRPSLELMKTTLRDRIKSAKTIDELTAIYQRIEFDLLKEFTLGCFDQFTPDQIAKLFYSAPIDQILSDDVIKKIFSFAPYCARATNKHMNALGADSELIEMKKLYKPYQENPNDETWIVHPKRTHLNEIEKEFGFKGIVNSIGDGDAIGPCKSGGRMLIHSGVYVIAPHGFLTRDKVQMIGVGHNVILDGGYCSQTIMLYTNRGHFDFENITFSAHGSLCHAVIVEDGSVTATNCKYLGFEYSIHLTGSCNVKINDCLFDSGGRKGEKFGICCSIGMHNKCSTDCSLLVQNSKFDDIPVWIHRENINVPHPSVKIYDNILNCDPVTIYISAHLNGSSFEKDLKRAREDLSTYILNGNVFGKQREKKQAHEDPNQVRLWGIVD